MPSPPKPWEVNNAGSTPTASAAVTSPTTAANITQDASNAPPTIPERSTSTLNRPAGYGTTTGYGTTGYGSSGYGSSGYGSMGYGSTGYGSTGYGSMGYGSSYGGYGSSYGGYGSSYGRYGGGIGSYGGGYGSYGGGYGGYNRFGGGYGGGYGNRMMGPEGEMGLTQRMEMGTRPAFEVIEQIVGAFGGFAQMLDSTFMATHSSFMAIVGMAEQLGHLRSYLGQVFSILALYRLARRMLNKVLGRVEPGRPDQMNFMEFQQYESKLASKPKISRKPIFIFLFMIVGLPYLMHKLIQVITAKQQEQMKLQGGTTQQQQEAMMLAGKIDPAKLEFARATYDFAGENPSELNMKKGDIVAILAKNDPVTNQPSQWWRGRLRDGRMGMFPANYVEIVQKAPPPPSSPSQDTAVAAAAPTNDTTATPTPVTAS